MTDRFTQPGVGPSAAARFPAITKATLPSGLAVWTLPHHALPVSTVALVVPFGSAHDPADRPGLAGVLGDLLDEGAGDRPALELAAAFAALGTEVSVDVGPDVTTVSLTTLSRVLEPALDLLFDVAARPRLEAPDFQRVVEMRLNRLRQLRSSASAMADRLLLRGVFGDHPYGHGTLGSAESLESVTLEQVRQFYATHMHPSGATCVVAGDMDAARVHDLVARHAQRWSSRADASLTRTATPVSQVPTLWMVDKPGASQTEVRVGHLGPSRHVADYYPLVTLNAVLGGQFTSRINQNLREARGLTYGAHTSFDFRVAGGAFSCDTAVQSDATPLVVREILAEWAAIGGSRPAAGDELARAKASLTRGYVRHFETPAQLAMAACRLITFGLPDDTFARFVPSVESVETDAVTTAARTHVRPDDAAVCLVGDASVWRDELRTLGLPIKVVELP